MKALLRILGSLSPVSIWAFLSSKGQLVGEDSLGNRYYRAKARPGYNHERRFVMYKLDPDASLVPPEWHGWLHHQTDVVPADDGLSFRKEWQLPWQPNMTGTTRAHVPPGHQLAGGVRDAATGDYTPWQPKSKQG